MLTDSPVPFPLKYFDFEPDYEDIWDEDDMYDDEEDEGWIEEDEEGFVREVSFVQPTPSSYPLSTSLLPPLPPLRFSSTRTR